MKKLLFMFAVAAALFTASCSSSPATPSDAAADVYALIIDGQYEAAADAFDYTTPDPEKIAQQKAVIAALFTEKLAPTIEKKGGVMSAVPVSEVIAEDGKSATVTMKITYGNGTEEDTDVDMVLTEDGKWKPSMKK